MAPGECIVQDRGEFCNKVANLLAEEFNCEIRVISAGRPQANGQAEAYVKNFKTKLRAIMVDSSYEELPDNWDESLMHLGLQALRSDPAVSTGYAPGELLLGRKLVGPIELEKRDIDITGAELTQPLVNSLQVIHDKAFGRAAVNIKKAQEKYCRDYDARYAKNENKIRKNERIQIKDYHAKNGGIKGRMLVKWRPFRSFYKVHSVNHKKGVITIRSKGGRIYKKRYPLSRVRRYRGK